MRRPSGVVRLVLLGDSVVDNGAYVAPGEPDVATQLRAELGTGSGVEVEMRAVDGQRCGDVAGGLDRAALPDRAAVFLSAGGNDALERIDLLSRPAPGGVAEAFGLLHEVREAFRRDYAALLDRLAGRPVLVATIYDPAFEGDEAALRPAASAALSVFDDVIQSKALSRGMRVLDLRRLFTDRRFYANPIEPSSAGGALIAEAVARWVRSL